MGKGGAADQDDDNCRDGSCRLTTRPDPQDLAISLFHLELTFLEPFDG